MKMNDFKDRALLFLAGSFLLLSVLVDFASSIMSFLVDGFFVGMAVFILWILNKK